MGFKVSKDWEQSNTLEAGNGQMKRGLGEE